MSMYKLWVYKIISKPRVNKGTKWYLIILSLTNVKHSSCFKQISIVSVTFCILITSVPIYG